MADNKKRPAKVEKFLKPIFDPDDPDTPPDWYALLSLVCGIAGFFLKYRLFSWFAIFFSLTSFANVKSSEYYFKQQSMSFLFAISGLAMCYFGPTAYEVVEA